MKRIKRITVITMAIAVMMAVGCKQEDEKKPEEDPAKKRQEAQDAFEANLTSFPADIEEYLFEVTHATDAEEVDRVVFRKGESITYGKGGESFSGKLPRDIYAYSNTDGVSRIPKWEVTEGDGKVQRTYDVTLNPGEKIWGYWELYPAVEAGYYLTIQEYLGDGMLGGVIQSPEEFQDINPEYGNPEFKLTVLVPYAMVEGEDNYYVVGHDGVWGEAD